MPRTYEQSKPEHHSVSVTYPQKVLQVHAEIPLAMRTGGKVRSYHFFHTLAQRFELTLVVVREIPDTHTRQAPSSKCHEVIAETAGSIKRPSSRWSSTQQILQFILLQQNDHWVS